MNEYSQSIEDASRAILQKQDTRRGFLTTVAKVAAGVVVAGTFGLPKEVEAADGVQSFPWLPAYQTRAGILNETLALHDELDVILHGSEANIIKKNQPTSVRYLAAANRATASWAGECRSASIAAMCAPRIDRPITIAGITYSTADRLAIATLQYSGARIYEEYDGSNKPSLEEINARREAGEGIAVRYIFNPITGEEWWGQAQGKVGYNLLNVVKHCEWGQVTRNVVSANYVNGISGVAFFDPNSAHPGQEGNFNLINKEVGNRIIGLI